MVVVYVLVRLANKVRPNPSQSQGNTSYSLFGDLEEEAPCTIVEQYNDFTLLATSFYTQETSPIVTCVIH